MAPALELEGQEQWQNDGISQLSSRPRSPWRRYLALITLAELAAKHNVHPNMISQWKRKAQESLPDVFAKKADRSEAARERR